MLQLWYLLYLKKLGDGVERRGRAPLKPLLRLFGCLLRFQIICSFLQILIILFLAISILVLYALSNINTLVVQVLYSLADGPRLPDFHLLYVIE